VGGRAIAGGHPPIATVRVLTVPAGRWLFGYHDEQRGHYHRYTKRHFASREILLDPTDTLYFGFTLLPVCYLYSGRCRKPYPVTKLGDATKSSARRAS
jgi:hypothetical protein